MSHVIAERKVALLQDQFKLLQNEQVTDCWFIEKYGNLKCIDMRWAKVFALCNAERKISFHYNALMNSCFEKGVLKI